MHVVFVHQNFPAQFGHIARHLIQQRGLICAFDRYTQGSDMDFRPDFAPAEIDFLGDSPRE